MLRIGELAALAGVTTRTIRHYHRIGLLPDAARCDNGYRAYGLGDAVRLLRIRRLAELGLSLDEVADALADGGDGDLREILVELDASLAAEQARLRARRHAIAGILRSGGDLRVPAELAPFAGELAVVFGAGSPSLVREHLVLELLGAPHMGHRAPALDMYRRVLADDELREQLAELTARFDALAGLSADDPAVDALVADGSAAGDAVAALLPEGVCRSPGDPHAAELLFRAASAGMGPAQQRCLAELFEAWRRASS